MNKVCVFLLFVLSWTTINAQSSFTVKVKFDSPPLAPYEIRAVNNSGQRVVGVADVQEAYVFPAYLVPADLFLYQGLPSDTFYLGSIEAKGSKTKFSFPVELQRNLFGHYVCPKCHRADKTVKIVSSDMVVARTIITAGDTTYTSIRGRKKYEACMSTGRGYCQRDKIKF